jgi:hypothetical protein
MQAIGALAVLAAMVAATEIASPAVPAKQLCPKLAEKLPMRPPAGDRRAWRFDTRAGIKGLFAGTVTSQFGAGPIDENDGKAWQRAAAMCVRTAKGGECRLEGPVVFFVRFDETELAWQLEPGDKLLFRVRGTVMECEELALVPGNATHV